jgi:hypothetical protein
MTLREFIITILSTENDLDIDYYKIVSELMADIERDRIRLTQLLSEEDLE